MSVIRIYWVLRREIWIMQRRLWLYMLFLVLPGLLFALSAYSVGNKEPLPLAVVNYDNSPLTVSLLLNLHNSSQFTVKYSPVSVTELNNILKQDRAVLGIIIPSDFTSKLLRREQANILAQSDSYVSEISILDKELHIFLEQELVKFNLPLSGFSLQVQLGSGYNQILFILTGIILLLFYTIQGGVNAERKSFLDFLPLQRLELCLGKLIFWSSYAFCQGIFLLGLAKLCFALPVNIWVLSGLFLFAAANTVLGYVVVSLSKNGLQIMVFNLCYLVPSCFLVLIKQSGNFVSFIKQFIPLTHFVGLLHTQANSFTIFSNSLSGLFFLCVGVIFFSALVLIYPLD